MTHRPAALAALVCWGLACGPAFAGETWVEVRTPGFTVYGDDGEKAARRVAGRLEDMRGFLQEEWPWARFTPALPVVVLALRDRPRFEQLLPSKFGERGAVQVAGFTLPEPSRTLILLRGDVRDDPVEENPYHVVYHEYVHTVLGRNPLRLPLWLNEGLAEYWGSTKISDREVEFGRPIAMHVVTLRRRPSLPLETVFAVNSSSPHYNEQNRATIFYAESWLLVHYLALGAPGRKGQLNELAGLLGKGRDPLEAAREVLGDLGALRHELDEYASHSAFKFKRRQRHWPGDESPGAARRLPPAEVLALRGGVLLSVGRPGDGRVLLQEALELDPGLVMAAESLGHAAFLADDRAPARQWLERAVASGSAGFFTHYALGVLLSAETAPESLARAETELEESVRLNPEYALVNVGLAGVVARRGGAGDAALRLLRRAIVLAPNDATVHLGVAAEMLRLGRLEDALREAQAAEQLAPNARVATRARTLLRFLEERQAGAATRQGAAAPVAARPDPPGSPDAPPPR